MNVYGLPTSLTVSGVDYSIRSDFRAALDILIAFSDDELEDNEKAYILLYILYEDFEKIPENSLQEAIDKGSEFLDAGYKDDGRKHPKTVDWKQDAALIIPSINKVAHTEIRSLDYMHWWTFFAYYMEIGDGLFSSVVNIRQKMQKKETLEKYEQKFYKENRHLIDFENKSQLSDTEREELRKLFGFKK